MSTSKVRQADYLPDGKFNEAHDAYSEAILLNSTGPQAAIYYSNRSMVNIKLENYGIAIMGKYTQLNILDADKALEIDPKFGKAYYRRGSSYLALGHLNDAVKDFERVAKLFPQDKDAALKLSMAKKEKMRRAFADSIHKDEDKVEVNFKDIIVEDSYDGPRLEDELNVTAEWVKQVLLYMKD